MSNVAAPPYVWSTTKKPYLITNTQQANNLITAAQFAAYRGHVGFDLEWRPSFVKGEPEHPVALIQIATRDDVYLFQISTMSSFPSQLKALLENPLIMKVGVGIQSRSSQFLLGLQGSSCHF